MNLTRALWIALALAVLVWAALQLRGGVEGEIHARLDALAEVLEKDGDEGDLVAVAHSRTLSEFFAEGFRVSAPQVGGELTDRARLMQTYLGYRRRFTSIGVSFRERELVVQEGVPTVRVGCVATLSGRQGVNLSRDRFRLAMTWTEIGGEWVLSDVEVLEVLEGGF